MKKQHYSPQGKQNYEKDTVWPLDPAMPEGFPTAELMNYLSRDKEQH